MVIAKMSQQIITKNELVKRINYQTIFQEVAQALPSIMIERASELSNAEVHSIRELKGNIVMISLGITFSIRSLYKALPEYTEMRNLTPSSYTNFLFNALEGLTTIDDRLLKPPLIRLFGEEILIDDVLNTNHPLFPYLKICGDEFIALCEKPLLQHYERGIKEGFLSLMPYKTKQVSFDYKQLIYFPILKPLGTAPQSNDKWQLYYLATKQYCVPVDCTAEKSEDRYKVHYENTDALIRSAKDAVTSIKETFFYRPIRSNNGSINNVGSLDSLVADFGAELGFKNVDIKGASLSEVLPIYLALLEIKKKLGKLAKLVNDNTSLLITNIRKSSSYDRGKNILMVSVIPKHYECKIAYIYAQALDRLIATHLYDKKNHLGSDYWYLQNEPEDELHIALSYMYKTLSYQRSPSYYYSALLLDGLYGKHFFSHPAELFARALTKCLSAKAAQIELSVLNTPSASLLYPNDEELSLFELAVDSAETLMPEPVQTELTIAFIEE